MSSKHCYFYTLLITQFLSHFNPLCTSKKNLSPFVLWIFKKTYSLFLLNNTLIPSWRVAFNPRRKLVIKSMKPIFRAKNSIADWGRTWTVLVLWWLGFMRNIGIPNVKWNNKKITAKFILLYLIPWTNWFEWKMIFRERDFILHFGPVRPWHRPDNMPAMLGQKYEKSAI